MTQVTLHAGDNRESLRRLIDQGVRVHSVVTDPPYGLTSVQKRFGKEGSAPARRENNDGSFARLSGGFMGKMWDGTGIERDPEFWQLIYDILLPGGYVFAFSGSRTGHWQACAMELAGFVMHPMHGWCFGSGFPKAHNADKAIDKMLGQKGEVVAHGAPVARMIPGADQHKSGWEKTNGREYQPGQYVPATDEAAEWAGWAYGTQAQKPALEPIYLGQKPFSEKTGAANLLKHGVGAVNIDGCRVALDQNADARQLRTMQRADRAEEDGWGMGATDDATVVRPDGRWPANLLHDGSYEVVELFPFSAGQQGDVRGDEPSKPTDEIYGQFKGRVAAAARNDSGSAARFFNSFPPDDIPPLFYNGKAGKADRAGSKHPTVKPVALMRHLVRHITPPGGLVLDPFAGSGTTAEAARQEGFDCVLMEAEPEYVDFLRQRFGLPDHAEIDPLFSLLGIDAGQMSVTDSRNSQQGSHASPSSLTFVNVLDLFGGI